MFLITDLTVAIFDMSLVRWVTNLSQYVQHITVASLLMLAVFPH